MWCIVIVMLFAKQYIYLLYKPGTPKIKLSQNNVYTFRDSH